MLFIITVSVISVLFAGTIFEEKFTDPALPGWETKFTRASVSLHTGPEGSSAITIENTQPITSQALISLPAVKIAGK